MLTWLCDWMPILKMRMLMMMQQYKPSWKELHKEQHHQHHQHPQKGQNLPLPSQKEKKKVDDHVICGIPESAGQNLVADVVLELEESEMANKRGHVVIAIENPNPDLDIEILVRRGEGLEFAAVDFTVNLCCFLVSSNMTNRVDGNTSYPPSQMKDYVYCDQVKQTFNQMCFFSL